MAVKINLGSFKTAEEAAKNYDYYANKLWDGDCYLNFPDFDYTNFIPKRQIDLSVI